MKKKELQIKLQQMGISDKLYNLDKTGRKDERCGKISTVFSDASLQP